MRKQGEITRWDDAKGFGFIARDRDGSSDFVHISAFAHPTRRPVVGDKVTYELGRGKDGKSRAENARFADEVEAPTQAVGWRKRGTWPVWFAVVFVGFLIAAAALGRLSWLIVMLYGVMSVATFIVYGWDKLSAKLGRWRTAEATLHVMGLAGGWPGALAAQRLLRHKSSKQEFLSKYWITVFFNIAIAGYLVWAGEAGVVYQAIDRVWQLFGTS